MAAMRPKVRLEKPRRSKSFCCSCFKLTFIFISLVKSVLQKESDSYLDQPGIVSLARNRAECVTGDTGIRPIERGRVGHVERFGSELRLHALHDGKRLEQRNIEVDLPGTSHRYH